MHLKAIFGGCLAAATVAAGVVPSGTAAAAPAGPAPAVAATGDHVHDRAFRSVTLITGDRLSVATDGSNRVAVQPTPGREQARFITRLVDGDLQVTPVDALPLVNSGRLDQRLFDVTGLLKFGYDDRRADLPLIVSYAGAAKASLRADAATADATVTRDLPAVNGLAVAENRAHAVQFWNSLTGGSGANTPRALRAEVGKVWLDGQRKVVDDVSTPQIGAPQAWAAGYTGAGVTVGVVDTGIDGTHPDLAGKVVAAQNFSTDTDLLDHVGHGTHVASIITGSGAASGGRYEGVAPGVQLYSAKVCQPNGSCLDSAILAGMQWAAADEHVKVVNMSLGGGDSPGVDPLEQAVNTLTEQYGTLFVIAAGNDGGDGTVGSPSTADDALSVGAVDSSDKLASFSSRGPRVGDYAVKPDITAPGVDIVAARGKDATIGTPTGPGGKYMALSGTSMATPHVTGSAAILAGEHPDWTPARLKAALMAAAKPNPAVGVYAQGAGRVDIGRAVKQAVTATPVSVSYGLQSWPHTDDTPISRTVTYHNAGTAAVTLALAVNTTGPDGKPTPAGLFTVSPATVTVPAGGDAAAAVTVDTKVDSQTGYLGGELTASAGDTAVQTPVAVVKEAESYDVTLTHLDRTGNPTGLYGVSLYNLDTGASFSGYDASGTVKIRVPKGRYTAASSVSGKEGSNWTLTSLVQPLLTVDRPQNVTMDARLGKPEVVTVPNPEAQQAIGSIQFTIITPGHNYQNTTLGFSFDGIYTAQIGPPDRADEFVSLVNSQWQKPSATWWDASSPYQYLLAWVHRGSYFSGITRAVTARQLATVHKDMATETVGASAITLAFAEAKGSDDPFVPELSYTLPNQHTEYYNTDGGVQWSAEVEQAMPATGGFPFPVIFSGNQAEPRTYRAGRTYRELWNRGVLGPAFPTVGEWVSRDGDLMIAQVPLYSETADRAGFSGSDHFDMALYKDGVKVADTSDVAAFYELPAASSQYKITIDASRGLPHTLDTAVSAAWTFRSGHTKDRQPLALSAVRFQPRLDAQNTAPSGVLFPVPIQVVRQAGSAAGHARTLDVQVSYDDGRTWARATVLRLGDNGVALLHHPTGDGYVSLKAASTDTAGNTVQETIIRAYRY